MHLRAHRLPYQERPRPLALAEDAGLEQSAAAKDELPSQLIAELEPQGDEIVVTKTTDSALTGTNLRLILTNLGIKTVVCCGIFTDQCVSSTVRSLADESFGVVVVEDCCAAGSDELHRKELEIINMIYCHVMSSAELTALMGLGLKSEAGQVPRRNSTPIAQEALAFHVYATVRAVTPELVSAADRDHHARTGPVRRVGRRPRLSFEPPGGIHHDTTPQPRLKRRRLSKSTKKGASTSSKAKPSGSWAFCS